MKKSSINVLVFLFLTVLIQFIFGFYFNAYGATLNYLFSGLLLDNPLVDTHFVCCLGQDYVLSKLYNFFPNISWFPLSLLIGYFLIFISFLVLAKNAFPIFNHAKIILIALFFLLLIINEFVFLGITFLASFLVVLGFLLSFLIQEKSIKDYILIGFITVLGIIYRFDMTILIASIFTIPILVFEQKMNFKAFKALLPFIVINLLLIVAFLVDKQGSSELYKAGEPQFYFISDGKFAVPIDQMGSAQDSIKYMAVRRYFLNDEENITLNFVLSLVEKPNNILEIISRSARSTWESGKIIFKKNPVFYLAFPILWFFLIFLSKRRIAILIAPGLGLVLIFFVGIIFKLEHRMVFPILFGLILYLLFQERERLKKLFISNVLLILFLLSELLFFGLKHAEAKKNAKLYSDFLFENGSKFENILIDRESSFILNVGAFKPLNELGAEIYTIDMGQLTYLPQYNSFLESKCNCNNKQFLNLINYIESKNNLNIYLTSPENADFLKQYVKVIYNENIEFKKVELNNIIDNINAYQITN